MTQLLWPLLGMLAGAFIAIQAPINAELARGLGQPVAAAAISFLSGAVVLGLVTAFLAQTQGASPNWKGPALWLFVVGGMLGAVYVTSAVILTPKLGAAALMAFLVAGQLIAGLAVDRIGFMGLAVRELSLGRVAGAGLLLVGALLIRFT